MNDAPVLWKGNDGIVIPSNAKSATDIVPFAANLTEKQQQKIINAFEIEAYDMASEYAWKKAMASLKETLASLGMRFIGEMLGRPDIEESTPYENVLTDYNTIQLAEQLNILGPTAAMHLKQSLELIGHYFSSKAEEDLDFPCAINIIKNAVKYILGYKDVSAAIEFSYFRNRLLSESLNISDPQIEALIGSPLFFIRTANFVLLSTIRNERGARLEHALANLNLILPSVWDIIGEKDKWNVGAAYKDVTSEGNTIAASGLKQALLKVNGFDYVPENLRSNTFKKAAKLVIETHFSFNNFYNEPSVVSTLANLGTTIPSPALLDCMQAYLIVLIGNRYGTSHAAAVVANTQLSNLSKDRWYYYFSKGIDKDEIVLWNFDTRHQVHNFSTLLNNIGFTDFKDLPNDNQKLYDALVKDHFSNVKSIAESLYFKISKPQRA